MSQNKARTPFDDPDNSGVDIPLSKNTQPLPPPGTVLGGLQSGVPTGNMATTPPDYSAPDYSAAPQPPAYAPPGHTPQPPAYSPPAYTPPAPPAYAPPTAPPQPPAYSPPPAYPTQPPAYAPPAHPTVAYSSAPPIAVPPVAVPAASAPTGPLPGSRFKMPLPTLIGLAVAGGVTLAVVIPIMLRRAIPTVEMKTPPPAVAVSPPIARKPIAKAPIVDDGLDVGPAGDANADAAPAPQRPLPRATSRVSDEPGDSGVSVGTPEGGSLDSAPAGTEEGVVPGAESPDAEPGVGAAGSADDSSGGSEGQGEADGEADGADGVDSEPASSDSPRAASGVSVQSGQSGTKRGGSRGSARNAGSGYSITAPAGWAKKQSGRRSIWAGPGGSQLLVEVSDDVGSSPRADWEKLDRAFRKKYGRRYRNLGIRNTTLAGLRAAEWEFELDSKSGTTRKIDVAVHDNGRGYAVLGSGRAEDMPELRPQIQAAIDSFQLKSSGESGAGEPERGF